MTLWWLRRLDSPAPVRLYVAAVTAAGTGVLVASVLGLRAQALTGSRPVMFWLFAALLILAECRPMAWLRLYEGGEMTASWTFACAILLIAPLGSALALMALGSVASDLLQRKPLVRVAFNAGQVCLSLAAGDLVLHALGWSDGLLLVDGISMRYLIAVALAGTAIYSANVMLATTVIALHQATSLRALLRSGFTENLNTDGMLLALAPIFVVVADESLLLVPVLLVAAYSVYRSASLALARKHEATHDQLTNLPNRRLFYDSVQSALAEANEKGRYVAIALLDLDGFKEVNDRLGHHVGDLVLEVVARRLQRAMRPSDLVARLGGDEFALLLRGSVEPRHAERIARRLLADLRKPCMVQGFPIAIGGSFGIATHPVHGDNVDTLMQHADVAMYQAKQAGTGVQVYESTETERGRGRLMLLSDLQRAVDERQLVLHYQPKVELESDRILSLEALVRWNHPVLGVIPPAEFMPLAEHTELMGQFTEYVLRDALRQCADWHRAGMPVNVAVNGSARNLHDLRFPSTVKRLLDEASLPSSALELEITENTVMADPTRTMAVLRQLREQGISLSIDDFGTGYSSLANLRNLPVDAIKIDRSFVTQMLDEADDLAIVRSIIELADNLGLRTVAEGVERAETYQALSTMGCDEAQGYYICKPAPADAVTDLLRVRYAADRRSWLTDSAR